MYDHSACSLIIDDLRHGFFGLRCEGRARFMESRLRVYVGREKMLRELAEYVAGDSTTACLVTGAAGSGKTAALARLVQLVQSATLDRTIARPVVVAHFIGASSTSSSLRQLLRRLCLVLTAEFGLDEDVPTGSDGLSAHFQGLLARIPADRRTVLVLDALDRLDETSDAQSVS